MNKEQQKKSRADYQSEYMRNQRAANNEIGPVPACVNPERRERTKNDFVAFCKEYGGEVSFFRDWKQIHYDLAGYFEDCVLNGGKRAVAAPRGTCKTTFGRWAVKFAMLQHPEKHKHVVYLGAVGGATKQSMQFIYDQLRLNEFLFEDFPEVCFPFQAQKDNKQKRCTINEVHTNVSWTEDEIVFPTVEGSAIPPSVITFRSIGAGGIRGIDVSILGKAERPTLVVIDDPQSDASAQSELMVGNMYDIVTGTIKNLAGYDRKTKLRHSLSVIAVVTCIAPNDLAIQLLDRKKSPEYRGRLYKRLDPMPLNMDLWKRYREVRYESFETHGNISLATEFYRSNREAMDEGAKCIDDDDYEAGMISGIQFGMEHWADNQESFFREQQNDPESALYSDGSLLSVPMVLHKRNSLQRCCIPDETAILTAQIDVGIHYLNYAVTAFGENFKFVHTVDYGVFPDQGVPKINKSNFVVGIQEKYTKGNELDRMKQAITDCLKHIFTQTYTDERGEIVDVYKATGFKQNATGENFRFLSAVGVDAADGVRETTVWKAVAEFNRKKICGYAGRVIPTYGDVGRSRLIRYYDLKPGEWRRGEKGDGNSDWIENQIVKEPLRLETNGLVPVSFLWDTNTFRTERNRSWVCPKGREGTHTLFSDSEINHLMFAEHQCAEDYTPSRLSGTDYYRWKMKRPRFSDNEFFDIDAACFALAAYVGIQVQTKIVYRDVPRMKISRDEYLRLVNRR